MRRAPKGATFGEGEVMSQGALRSKAAMGRLRRVHLGLGQKAVSEGDGNGLEAAESTGTTDGGARWQKTRAGGIRSASPRVTRVTRVFSSQRRPTFAREWVSGSGLVESGRPRGHTRGHFLGS